MYEEKEEDDEQWPVAQVIVPANALEYLQSIYRNPAEPDGDYQEFRARGRFSSLADEPFAEDDGELGLGLEPFARRPFPFVSRGIAASSPRRHLGVPSCANGPTELGVQRLDRVVTGMRIPVPAHPAGTALVLAYGVTIRDEGHREHVSGQADPYDEP